MAKQLGIHQLRGKVGDRSYYTQKGIDGGLTRRISPSISEDVKTKESYATFRVAGKEFGGVSMLASTFIHSIAERHKVIISRNAQSRLIESILKALPTHSERISTGYRALSNTSGIKFLEPLIESVNKNPNQFEITKIYSNFDTLFNMNLGGTSSFEFNATLSIDAYFQTWLGIQKYDRVQLQIVTCCSYLARTFASDVVNKFQQNYIVKYATPRYYTNLSGATSITSTSNLQKTLDTGSYVLGEVSFPYVLFIFTPQKKVGGSYVSFLSDGCFFVFSEGTIRIAGG